LMASPEAKDETTVLDGICITKPVTHDGSPDLMTETDGVRSCVDLDIRNEVMYSSR
jgi:hypothetical protein